MKDIIDLLNKAFEDVSKDWEERVLPFIEKAKQSIKHPHFYYAEVDTEKLAIEYKRKKWYQWLSGKRVVHIKLPPIGAGLPSYSPMNNYCLYEWDIKKESKDE